VAYMAVVVRPWRRVRWRSVQARRWLVLSGIVASTCLALLAMAYGDLVVTRFLHLGNPLEATSIQERLHDYRQAWGLIRDVPLKGTGSGYYVDALWAGVGEDRPPGFRHVHNVPLLATAELGLGGGILWLAFLVSPPIYLMLRARASPDLSQTAGLAAAFVSAGVIGMLDTYLYVVSTWWSSLYLGILAGAWASALSAWAPAEGGP
jgi:O-antigen ligase